MTNGNGDVIKISTIVASITALGSIAAAIALFDKVFEDHITIQNFDKHHEQFVTHEHLEARLLQLQVDYLRELEPTGSGGNNEYDNR